MGGSAVHNKISGVADREGPTTPTASRPCATTCPTCRASTARRCRCSRLTTRSTAAREELYDIVPANARKAYDMRRVIKAVVDDGAFFPMKPDWAQEPDHRLRPLRRAVRRRSSRSQPMHMAGSLDMHSADKAARFINLCDSFDIPLVFLVDVPGFVVGKKVEHDGIIRHGAKMLWNVSEATVPKITVVLRKAYGAGYFVMAGRAYESDYLVAWPTAEFSVMGPDGAVNILFRKQLAAAEEGEARDALRAELVAGVRSQIDPFLSAKMGLVDDIIDPADTRAHIVHGLEVAAGKRLRRPIRKRGVTPV